MFRLSNRSLSILATVHEDMQKVVKRAIEITKVDFGVIQGLRTLDEQYRLYGKGRTPAQCAAVGCPREYSDMTKRQVTWIDPRRGNHLSGNAVDLAAFVHGKIDWNNLDLYRQISLAMKQAAEELKVPIVWGGDWKTTKDFPHYELRARR